MSFYQHVNKVDCAKEPTPTDNHERKEYNDVYGFFRSKHNGQSDQNFAYPTYNRKKQKDCFYKRRLAVEPFVESCQAHDLYLLKDFYVIIILLDLGFVNNYLNFFIKAANLILYVFIFIVIQRICFRL